MGLGLNLERKLFYFLVGIEKPVCGPLPKIERPWIVFFEISTLLKRRLQF